MSQNYDDWDDSVDVDQKESSGRRSGKKFSYFHQFDDTPTWIHLAYPEKPYVHPKTGKELPFRPGRHHFLPGRGKGKGLFMECGEAFGEKCVTCAYSNPAAFKLEGVAKDDSLAKCESKPYYAVAAFIEEDHHLVEYYFDERDADKGTFKRRERCLGRGCEFCDDGLPMVFGRKIYFEMSPAQWRFSIHDLHKKIENRYCRCGGDIYVASFNCQNCNQVMVDVSLTCNCGSTEVGIDTEKGEAVCDKCGSRWSAFYTDHKKIYEDSIDEHNCKNCGHRGKLRADRFCSTEGCEVNPYSVFDAALRVKRTGTKKNTRFIIEEWKIQPLDKRLFDIKAQGNDDWAPKVVDANKKPLDLDKLLQPDSADEQAKVIGKPNPFTAAGMGVGRYARYDGDEATAS